jgi:hypothetical protein
VDPDEVPEGEPDDILDPPNQPQLPGLDGLGGSDGDGGGAGGAAQGLLDFLFGN